MTIESHSRAYTLVELILVIGLLSIIGTATVGLIRSSNEEFLWGRRRSHLLQEGHAALAKMARTLRQASKFTSVSGPGNTAGSVVFEDNDGDMRMFQLDTDTGELRYGISGDVSALVDSVTSLTLTCYDRDGAILSDPVVANQIKSLAMALTLIDTTDSSISFSLSERVFWPCDSTRVMINELMYNPTSNPESPYEWVELYNLTDTGIDLENWTIWTGSASTEDTLTAHAQYGDGTTIIAAQGYALVITNDAELFEEQLKNGDFESPNLNDWDMYPSNSWSSTKYNAHGGSRKGESALNGTSTLMQEITLPGGLSVYTFSFWEMTSAVVPQTSLTVTVRNTSDVVLETGYTGTFHSTWTHQNMDLSAYAGQTIRIHFTATKTDISGVVLLDDVSVSCSNVPNDIPILSVDDGAIGNGLDNNGDTVTITNGTTTIDCVVFDDSWGGDGDGRSLERIDPSGGSSEASNWQAGAIDGSPGAAN